MGGPDGLQAALLRIACSISLASATGATMAKPVAVAAGDEQDELFVAGDCDLDPGERRRVVQRGAELGPAVGLGRGAAGGAFGGDDRLEAASDGSRSARRASPGGDAFALRPGEGGGEFGEAGLVVAGCRRRA